jgi:hypothetical protein
VSVSRYLVPFAAGVAVGVTVHKYWPQIKEAAGPSLEKGLAEGERLFERARTAFWEQSEKFSDLVAEIREEEEAAARSGPPPAT